MFLLFIEIMYCRSNVILSIQWDMYSTIFKLSLYIICKIHFISAAVNESMSRGSYRRFGRLEAEAEWRCKTTCGGAPAVHPPPLYSLSVAGGRRAGAHRETTLNHLKPICSSVLLVDNCVVFDISPCFHPHVMVSYIRTRR